MILILGRYKYAEEVVNSQLQGQTIPDVIAAYVDCDSMAADWLLGGEIFTIEISSYNDLAEEEKGVAPRYMLKRATST